MTKTFRREIGQKQTRAPRAILNELQVRAGREVESEAGVYNNDESAVQGVSRSAS